MKIVLLNGNPDEGDTGFDGYLSTLGEQLTAAGHAVNHLMLREMKAGYCTGCWSCWVKTPGECMFKDDSHTVCRAIINSDLTIFASPVIMGYLSALLKKYMDKIIPLLLPYITEDQGEAHHAHRYEPADYPVGGLLLEKTPGTDQEDIDIIQSIHARTMLNLKTYNAFTLLTDQPVEEALHAINSI
jgi:multimeric flavodoxin WrbA